MQAEEVAAVLGRVAEWQTVFVKYLVPSITPGKPQERWVDLQITRNAPEALYGLGFRAGKKVDWHLRSKEGKNQIRIDGGPWWQVVSVEAHPMRAENQR